MPQRKCSHLLLVYPFVAFFVVFFVILASYERFNECVRLAKCLHRFFGRAIINLLTCNIVFNVLKVVYHFCIRFFCLVGGVKSSQHVEGVHQQFSSLSKFISTYRTLLKNPNWELLFVWRSSQIEAFANDNNGFHGCQQSSNISQTKTRKNAQKNSAWYAFYVWHLH